MLLPSLKLKFKVSKNLPEEGLGYKCWLGEHGHGDLAIEFLPGSVLYVVM